MSRSRSPEVDDARSVSSRVTEKSNRSNDGVAVADSDVPTTPPKAHVSRPQRERPISWRSGKGGGGGGGSPSQSPSQKHEDALESDLDFIRELTQYRGGGGGGARGARNNEWVFVFCFLSARGCLLTIDFWFSVDYVRCHVLSAPPDFMV